MQNHIRAKVCIATAVCGLLLSDALAQPSNNQKAALANMCGSDFRQSVQKMMAGRLSGQQATQCWCYFWEKGGSNPLTMYNGRRASDLCKPYLASASPPGPPAAARTVERLPSDQNGNAAGTDPRGDWVPPGGPAPDQVTPGLRPTTTAQTPPEQKAPGGSQTPEIPTSVEKNPSASTTPTNADNQPPSSTTPTTPRKQPPASTTPTKADKQFPGSTTVTDQPSTGNRHDDVAGAGAHGRHAGGRPYGGGKPTNEDVSSPEPAECPHRGKGCVALIIDFSRQFKNEENFEALSESLKNAGCSEVDYVAPSFVPDPPYNYNVNYSDHAAAEQWNENELAKIQRAVETHRKRVTQGAELAVEIIKGHGGAGSTCGLVLPGFDKDWPVEIDRADFHFKNYKAAYKNTCAWFVADFSCFSGQTPEAVDELNNNGAAKAPLCARMPAENCANHAAYELDVAVGSSKSDTVCTKSDSRSFNDQLNAAINGDAEQNTKHPYSRKPLARILSDAVKDMPSVYTDGGRKYCNPLRRDGYWLSNLQRSCSNGACR